MNAWYDKIPKWVWGEQQDSVPPAGAGIGYTGNGGNGLVEPGKPVKMVQSIGGPVMLHEGEGEIQNPDGTVTVVPQSQLAAMEQRTGMPGMAIGGTYTPATPQNQVTQPTQAQPTITSQQPSSGSIGATTTPNEYYQQGMKTLGDMAQGKSSIFDNMENRAMTGFGGSSMAAIGAAKQEASQAGMSKDSIGNVAQTTMRNLEGERSKLMGEIASQKQAMASQAAGQLISGAVSGEQVQLSKEQFEEQKKQFYGWTDEHGAFHKGTYELMNAQDQRAADALYGYDVKDAQGNVIGRVMGSMELSKEQFEEQKKQFYGWTDDQGVFHKGTYELMNAQDQRAADALYGYDVKDAQGNVIGHVKGSMELSIAGLDLERQGLDLQSAQIKGYLDPETGMWVPGSVQLNAQKAGMEMSSLYGYYYDPKTGEVVTDANEIARRGDELERVDGALGLAAKQFGLQTKAFNLQYQELFGVDPETGERLLDANGRPIQGRVEIMNSEDRRAAEQLYGWTETVTDPVTGETTTIKHRGTLQLMEDEMTIKQQGLTLQQAQLKGYEKDGKHIPGELEIENSKLDIYRQEYEAQQSNELGVALASHFNLMANTAGYDWRNDQQAQRLMQDYWEAATGSTEPFDEEWAERQFNASTISQVDASLNRLEGEDWFKEMDPERQEELKQIVSMASYLSVTQGISPTYGEDGEITSLVDSEGNTIWTLSNQENASGQPTYRDITKDDAFGELEAAGKITEDLWKASGAKTIEEYNDWYDAEGKFQNVRINSSGLLTTIGGTSVPIEDYPSILRGANVEGSVGYETYTKLLEEADTLEPEYKEGGRSYDFNLEISSTAGNRFRAYPPVGKPFNIGDRLMYVEKVGRYTGGGRDADTVTFVDVATGQKRTFSAQSYDRNAGYSIYNFNDWFKTLN